MEQTAKLTIDEIFNAASDLVDKAHDGEARPDVLSDLQMQMTKLINAANNGLVISEVVEQVLGRKLNKEEEHHVWLRLDAPPRPWALRGSWDGSWQVSQTIRLNDIEKKAIKLYKTYGDSHLS
jgi:hypothetical protein